jgi:hypothetical protein
MRCHPILFSAPMIRALLAGRKTQTRRMAKVVRDVNFGCEIAPSEYAVEVRNGNYENVRIKPGDQMWVRETWADGFITLDGVVLDDGGYHYRASDTSGVVGWKPSIHMPRAASRLTLSVTDVRIERLQAISDHDCLDEGVSRFVSDGGYGDAPALLREGGVRGAFKDLWSSINGDTGPAAWLTNPWVIVYVFTVAHRNIDTVSAKREKLAPPP